PSLRKSPRRPGSWSPTASRRSSTSWSRPIRTRFLARGGRRDSTGRGSWRRRRSGGCWAWQWSELLNSDISRRITSVRFISGPGGAERGGWYRQGCTSTPDEPMQTKSKQRILAPRDLSKFLSRRHLSRLDLDAALGERERPARFGPLIEEL